MLSIVEASILMTVKYLTKNLFQTQRVGRDFAKKITGQIRKKAVVLALEGNLGGGKTTFLQGFAKGLGIKEKILSPTFVILKKFKIKDLRFKIFYHIDCYRIQKPKEILDLGFNEILSDSKNIVAVEWAGRIKKILPKTAVWINLKFINRNTREIVLK